MLNRILCVSFSVANLSQSLTAFTELLGYVPVCDEPVSAELAAFWGACEVEGRRVVLLRPASREAVYVRLVANPPTAGYAPLKTYGWNAAEFHVRDVKALARELRRSAFEIIGGPRDLLGNGTAVALQVRGPSNELLYLTEINSRSMQESYGRARSYVGRLFIAVLGASNHSTSLAHYAALTGRKTRPRQFPIRVLAAAHGLDPASTEFTIASAVLGEAFRIEIDGYPLSATERPVAPGFLPPGLCIVTVETPSLNTIGTDDSGRSTRLAEEPYAGRQARLLYGPDGEWLEVIESRIDG